jgi:DNA-binding MarR family transcriptional regulator
MRLNVSNVKTASLKYTGGLRAFRIYFRRESMKKVYDKTQAEGTFIRLPSDLRNYIYMPNFKAEMCYLYGLIVDYYNADWGYAFPSVNELAFAYGKSAKTTSEHLKVLEECGLIKRSRTTQNNIYIPYYPLSKNELFKKFPEAKANYEKALAKRDEEKERSKRNLEKYKSKREETIIDMEKLDEWF